MKKKSSVKEETNDFGDMIFTPVNPNGIDTSWEPVSDPDVVVTRCLPSLGVYLVYPHAIIPVYSTTRSACFDVRAYLGDGVIEVTAVNKLNTKGQKKITFLPERGYARGVNIEPGECVFVPTGLIFDIPAGYKLLAYPRSGLSAKQHLILANSVGVIDEDYVEETMILLFNESGIRQFICDGDRIAQMELVPVVQASFLKIDSRPEQKTNRNGGMGSTGMH
jgi:dUTP pyrophosphatase